MNQPASGRLPRFTWRRLAPLGIVFLLIPGLLASLAWRTHQIGTALAMAIFGLSLVGFFGYRLNRLQREIATGRLTAQEYWRDPQRCIRGPTAPLALWFALTFIVMLGLVVLFAFRDA